MATKSNTVVAGPKWLDITKKSPPVNKEVACYNPKCGCKGRGYKSEDGKMVQILKDPTPKGDYFQDFKWQVTHWCSLINLPDNYDA